ncbi:hypothetical protein P43SY_009644 [Pythium insidiosum]|uniref:protein-tyrosine-phosphatase n=1 Tax=Pythium insidiosum TaxID=114742 RepID=A0AAD5M268_PYTIN|nr:hypothetical protein P43SY_009644 [Pythium insidiosum]
MKRRSAVTSRPIEFLPRRFFLVITRETPTLSVSSPRAEGSQSSALAMPLTPGLTSVELTRDVLQPAPHEQPLDLRHTLRVCRLLNAQRQAIDAPSPAPSRLPASAVTGRPRQLHFFLRSRRLADVSDAIQLLARWRLLCLQLSPTEAVAPFQHLQSLGDGAMRRLVASLSGLAKGVAQELLVPPRHFSSLDDGTQSPMTRAPSGGSLDPCFTRVTKRFLVFASPQDPVAAPGAPLLGPTLPEQPPSAVGTTPTPASRLSVAQLVPLLKQHRVTMVVRLNAEPRYDDQLIICSGIEHLDLSTPSDDDAPLDRLAIARFLESCENSQGVVAVHSSTGSGRAALCVACFLVKHARMSAAEATAWLRLCRPGALTLAHERLLGELQASLWRDGDEYRRLMEESLAFGAGAASTLTVSGGGQSADEPPAAMRLSSQFSVGRIALGRDSLLGTKDRAAAREKESPPSTRLALQAPASVGSVEPSAKPPGSAAPPTTLHRAHGSFRDIQAAQQLVAADPTLLRQRPLTQGAAGRRRLLDHHHHRSTSGSGSTSGGSASGSSDGGSLRVDFATMHKFVHQAGAAATSREAESGLTPRRPLTTASAGGTGGASTGSGSGAL